MNEVKCVNGIIVLCCHHPPIEGGAGASNGTLGGGGAWELVLSPDPTEILGYFNTMTQHFFGALSVLNYAYSKL